METFTDIAPTLTPPHMLHSIGALIFCVHFPKPFVNDVQLCGHDVEVRAESYDLNLEFTDPVVVLTAYDYVQYVR